MASAIGNGWYDLSWYEEATDCLVQSFVVVLDPEVQRQRRHLAVTSCIGKLQHGMTLVAEAANMHDLPRAR